MEAKDVIQLLRLQRHDMMNDLQVVHGYLSMGKTEKVKTKVHDMIDGFNRERVLMSIQCPSFALWLIQVKLQHKHIQFTYDIHTENINLQAYDDVLTKIGNTIINHILDDEIEIITGNIQLFHKDNSIELIILFNDPEIDYNVWKSKMSQKLDNVLIQVEEQETGIKFAFFVPSPE